MFQIVKSKIFPILFIFFFFSSRSQSFLSTTLGVKREGLKITDANFKTAFFPSGTACLGYGYSFQNLELNLDFKFIQYFTPFRYKSEISGSLRGGEPFVGGNVGLLYKKHLNKEGLKSIFVSSSFTYYTLVENFEELPYSSGKSRSETSEYLITTYSFIEKNNFSTLGFGLGYESSLNDKIKWFVNPKYNIGLSQFTSVNIYYSNLESRNNFTRVTAKGDFFELSAGIKYYFVKKEKASLEE